MTAALRGRHRFRHPRRVAPASQMDGRLRKRCGPPEAPEAGRWSCPTCSLASPERTGPVVAVAAARCRSRLFAARDGGNSFRRRPFREESGRVPFISLERRHPVCEARIGAWRRWRSAFPARCMRQAEKPLFQVLFNMRRKIHRNIVWMDGCPNVNCRDAGMMVPPAPAASAPRRNGLICRTKSIDS